MLKISIITVTFNNVKTIEQTIKSVLDQNYSNLEYIVIDGGSKDGALEILNKYKNKFNYFKSSPDEGVFDAMNKGISEATGDLIGFVNGGDFLYENTLQEINNLFYQKEKNLFFSVADVDYIDDENNVIGSTRCSPTKQILSRKYLEMPGNHLGCFVPLKAFKEVGLFETKFPYRADWLFFLLLIKKGYRPLHLKKKNRRISSWWTKWWLWCFFRKFQNCHVNKWKFLYIFLFNFSFFKQEIHSKKFSKIL